MSEINREFEKNIKFDFKAVDIQNEVILLDFKHLPQGKNCQTSALWRLLHHYQIDLSEEMLLGIGSGIGFIYWYMKMMPTPFAGAMNSGKFPGLIGRIIERLGGSCEVLKTSSVKTAYKHLKETLQIGQPAFVCVDMAYIDYMGMQESEHFGQHSFLVYGLDEPNNQAYISDRFNVPCTLPISRLQQARASPYPPFPAKNQMLRFTLPKNIPDLEPLIKEGIKQNVDYMFNPPIVNLGLQGILKWRNELPKYPCFIQDAETLVGSLWSHFIYIETGGSGGSFFRKMYTDFLNEAFEITGKRCYFLASELFSEIVDLWKSIAHAFLPNDFLELKEIREILYKDNTEMENKGNEALEGILQRKLQLNEKIKIASKYIIKEFSRIVDPITHLLEKVHQKEVEAFKLLS